MLYKIISKTLANRLKIVLLEVINEVQSGFISGRLITDNAIIALETFYWLQKGSRWGEKFMMIKLDMSKAYDKFERGVLKWMLSKLNFYPTFALLL